MSTITVKGVLTFAEYVDATTAFPQKRRMIMRLFLTGITCVLVGIYLALNVHLDFGLHGIIKDRHLATLAMLCFALPFFGLWILYKHKIAFQKSKAATCTAEYTLTPEGFNPVGAASIPWREFAYWRETPLCYCFVTNHDMYFILPKRLFPDDNARNMLLTWLAGVSSNQSPERKSSASIP